MKRPIVALSLSVATLLLAGAANAQKPPTREREEKRQTEDKKPPADDRRQQEEKRQAEEAARRQQAADEAARRDRERKALEARQAEERRQAEDAARRARSNGNPPPPTKETPPARKPEPPARQDPPIPPVVKPTPSRPPAREREEQTQAEPKPAPPVRRKPPVYYVAQPQGIFAVDETYQAYPVFLSNRVYGNRPVFCPEVRRVAFVAVEANRRTIHTIDPDGGDERRVTDPAWGDAYEPSWSPDGRYLAFVSDRDGDDAIYITDTERNTTRLVTPGFGRAMQPVWHPSGKYLVFISDRDTGFPALYKVSPWSGAPVLLTGVPAGPVSDPTISPDGKTLAFTIHRWEDRSDVFTYDLGWLSGMRRVASMKGRATRPAFSPDSFRVFFESRGELFSVKRLGGDQRSHGRIDTP